MRRMSSSRGYVEELLWLLGNLLALEEHYVDTVRDTAGYVQARMLRAVAQQHLVKAGLDPKRWCEVKHLLLSAVHFLECASALAASGQIDDEALKEIDRFIEASRTAFAQAKRVVTGEQ